MTVNAFMKQLASSSIFVKMSASSSLLCKAVMGEENMTVAVNIWGISCSMYSLVHYRKS